eukprot:gene18678-biopygen21970
MAAHELQQLHLTASQSWTWQLNSFATHGLAWFIRDFGHKVSKGTGLVFLTTVPWPGPGPG